MNITESNCNKTRGMKLVSISNNVRGISIKKAIPCTQTVQEFAKKMNITTTKLNAYLNKILENNTGGNINNNETVYSKVLEIYKKRTNQINTNYKRIGGGASPFVGAYYIDAHGMCSFPNKKVKIPDGKVVIFLAKATKLLGTSQTNRVEKEYLKTKDGVERLIKGSARENGMNNADFASRAHIEGESIFDQWIVFPRPPVYNVLNSITVGTVEMTAPFLGESSGHIWRLPLRPNHSRTTPFTSNNIKHVVNINGSRNYLKNRFGRAFKLSDVLNKGPRGVYIVATCREIIGKHAALHRPGNRTVISNVVNVNNNATRNLIAQNIRRQLLQEARKRRAAKKS